MRSDFYSNLDCETTVKSYCSFRLVFPVIAAAFILFAEVEEKEDAGDERFGRKCVISMLSSERKINPTNRIIKKITELLKVLVKLILLERSGDLGSQVLY
jgi:hypothetical protein